MRQINSPDMILKKLIPLIVLALIFAGCTQNSSVPEPTITPVSPTPTPTSPATEQLETTTEISSLIIGDTINAYIEVTGWEMESYQLLEPLDLAVIWVDEFKEEHKQLDGKEIGNWKLIVMENMDPNYSKRELYNFLERLKEIKTINYEVDEEERTAIIWMQQLEEEQVVELGEWRLNFVEIASVDAMKEIFNLFEENEKIGSFGFIATNMSAICYISAFTPEFKRLDGQVIGGRTFSVYESYMPGITLEEAQDKVNFTLLVPNYTAGYKFGRAEFHQLDEPAVLLDYYWGTKWLHIIETTGGINMPKDVNGTRVKVGDAYAIFMEKEGTNHLKFGDQITIRLTSTSLPKEELVKVAESMVEYNGN